MNLGFVFDCKCLQSIVSLMTGCNASHALAAAYFRTLTSVFSSDPCLHLSLNIHTSSIVAATGLHTVKCHLPSLSYLTASTTTIVHSTLLYTQCTVAYSHLPISKLLRIIVTQLWVVTHGLRTPGLYEQASYYTTSKKTHIKRLQSFSHYWRHVTTCIHQPGALPQLCIDDKYNHFHLLM